MAVMMRWATPGSGCKYLSRKTGSNVPTAIVNTYIKMILPQSPDMKMRQCGLSMIPAVIQLCRVQHCRRGNALSEQARPKQ